MAGVWCVEQCVEGQDWCGRVCGLGRCGRAVRCLSCVSAVAATQGLFLLRNQNLNCEKELRVSTSEGWHVWCYINL